MRVSGKQDRSCGYSSGAVYQVVEDESITHESWEKDLETYLDAIDESKGDDLPKCSGVEVVGL